MLAVGGLSAGTVEAQTREIVGMNFDAATGLEVTGLASVNNGGLATLNQGASIDLENGWLELDGTGIGDPPMSNINRGMDVDLTAGDPLNANGPFLTFGGESNFTVEFDFAIDPSATTASLFTASRNRDTGGDDFAGADNAFDEGEFNISFDEGGNIVADFWFVGAVGIEPPEGESFNDGEFRSLSFSFDVASSMGTLTVDDASGSEELPLPVRDTSTDIVRLGQVTNDDLRDPAFGATNPDSACNCMFDEFRIAEEPPPPPAALNLTLDAQTGAVSIVGTATTDAIRNFTISSPYGNLETTAYTGVSGNFDMSSGNPTFDSDDDWQIDSNTADAVTESDAPGGADNGTVVADAASFPVGGNGFWKAFPFTNLSVTAQVEVDGELISTVPGEVTVLNEAFVPLVGDIAGDSPGPGVMAPDGDVDVNDYLQLVEVFDDPIEELSGFDAYFLGDIDGNGFKNLEDFIAFRVAFEAQNGAGSFNAMVASLQSVPEPTAILLVAGGFGLLLFARRRTYSILMAFIVAVFLANPTNAQTTIFDYQFTADGADFSDSSSNTGTATPNIGAFVAPTTAGGKAVFAGDLLELLDVPLADPDFFGGTNDFTLSLDFSSMGNSFQSPGQTTGIVLFASVDSADPAQSFSVYVDADGSLAAEFVGSEGIVECAGCGLLDGTEHSIEVIYDAPDVVDDPGSLALKVDGSLVGLNTETFASFEGTTFLTGIGGHRQREIGGSAEFPTGCEEGACFTQSTQGTMDNVKLTDVASTPTVLRATVSRNTGEFVLLGGDFARDIVTIEIGAEGEEGGGLVPDNWNSFSDQNLDPVGGGDDPGETWDELKSTETQFVESFLLGSSLLDADDQISLGNIYDTAIGADFVEAFVGAINPLSGAIENIEVAVELIDNPAGDFNDDGTVNLADYTVWRDNLGGGTALLNDGGIGAPIGSEHYELWKAGFGNTSIVEEEEEGAAALAAAAVPEPTSWMLMAMLVLGFGLQAKRQCCAA